MTREPRGPSVLFGEAVHALESCAKGEGYRIVAPTEGRVRNPPHAPQRGWATRVTLAGAWLAVTHQVPRSRHIEWPHQVRAIQRAMSAIEAFGSGYVNNALFAGWPCAFDRVDWDALPAEDPAPERRDIPAPATVAAVHAAQGTPVPTSYAGSAGYPHWRPYWDLEWRSFVRWANASVRTLQTLGL